MVESYRDKLKRRQQQAVADKGKTGLGRKSVLDFSKTTKQINMFQPRTARGEINAFDILPFLITQEWYSQLRTPSGRPVGLGPGDVDYVIMLPLHSGVGPNNDVFLCLREAFGKACPVCEDMFNFYRAGDKKAGAEIRPRWRCWYNVYDYDDDGKYIQLFESSYYTFEATSKLDPSRDNLIDAQTLDDGGVVLFSDLEEGKTIVAKFKGKVLGQSKFAEVFEIQFEDRKPYTEDILNDTFPLDSMVIIPTYEDVKISHTGVSDDDSGTTDVPETGTAEEPVTGRARGRTRGGNAPEEKSGGEAPPWDAEGDWGQCPAGGNWGRDCNQIPACQGDQQDSCDEVTFNRCLEAYNIISARESQTEDSPKKTTEDLPPEKESAVTGRGRGGATSGRTRGGAATEEKKESPPAEQTRRRRGK